MKYIYIILGSIFSLFGIIGVFLPVLPTTPFILLAVFFFSRSSKETELWFKSTSFYRNNVKKVVQSREMTLKNKSIILCFASTTLIISFCLVNILFIRLFIAFLFFFKYYYFIFKIKTIKVEVTA